MRIVGSETPRLWTPPLRELTPQTSKGFEVIEFARLLGIELMPWQKWLLIHALELNEDGTYRFQTVIVLVSRQNGKTTLLKVLALWRLVLDNARLVLGTSTNLDYAAESWEGAVELAKGSADIAPEFVWPERRTNGQQTLRTATGARYKIAAATRKGGRSLSVDLGICDELREHRTWEAWSAISGATTASPDPQLWAISNAGEADSVVLNEQRHVAMAMIDAGTSDDMALFEWSAEDDAELTDRAAMVAANPALGHTITMRGLLAKLPPKNPPAYFRTEHLCQGVAVLDPAVPLASWYRGKDMHGTLAAVRDRVVAVVDVAPDGEHATLATAAQVGNGNVRVEIVAAWDSADKAGRDLPARLAEIGVKGPRVGWYPGGPAAAIKPYMSKIGAQTIQGDDVYAACMGLPEIVKAGRLLHPGDPLLDAHIAGCKKYWSGDRWRFVRRGAGHVDAAYAAAGAVHLAVSLPVLPKPMVV